MTQIKRIGDLEVNQDLEFQGRQWAAARVGWVVIAALLVAAMLGLFGVGLFSGASLGSQEQPISIEEYQRFVRFGKPTTLRVHLDSPSGQEVGVWVSREYMESIQLQQINPQPDTVEAGSKRLTYVFDVGNAGQPTAVTFNFQPQKVGPLKGQVGLAGSGNRLRISQFVYP